MNTLTVITLNVNCLNNAASRVGLVDFLNRNKPDIIFLQECNMETEELQSIVRGPGYSCSSNVTPGDPNARGTAVLWQQGTEPEEFRTHQENRMMSCRLGNLRFVNLYAPSGRSRRMERRLFFGEMLESTVRTLEHLPILLGDYNCILENKDALINPNQKKCESLRQVVNLYNYIDIFDFLQPNTQSFTFIRNNSASRIDRIYVPADRVRDCLSVSHIPAAFSDHLAVRLEIQVAGGGGEAHCRPNRYSYWKLNNLVLQDPDFNLNFIDMYSAVKQSIVEYNDIGDWWEYRAKPMFVTFLKQYSLVLARERKQTLEALYILLEDALSRGVNGYSEAILLKQRITEQLLIAGEGVKVRSRFKENLEKERASLYHLAREKKMAGANNLEKLIIGGVEVADKRTCEAEIINYYEPLFNGREGRSEPFTMEEGILSEFLNDDIGQLSDIERDNLDLPITEEELLYCVRNLPNNRTPGLDGLTNEFYRKAFPIIKNEYLAVQNCMLETGEIKPSMRQGVTRLTPKVKGVPRVDQLRPITMLNTDYNIRSRILTKRVLENTDTFLRSGQLCSNKKSNILSGVHNILSTIEYINQKELSAALLSFDMSKAFDRCFIPYVCKVLEKMNFSAKFISLIKDMHSGISTRFILNGLTAAIYLTFSIRQGDPIAMLLYLIYMEPFLLSLKKICTGVRVADFSQVDEDYADDIELVVEKEEEFILVDQLFSRFERCSGAVLSRSEKSKVMGLGGWRGRTTWPLPWLRTMEELKVLGFQILPTFDESLHRNWTVLVETFKRVLLSFSLRALDTLHQRSEVIKIYATSKLWYKAQVLPLPARYAQQLESAITRFLWRGKLEKLALQEIYNPPDQGGLGVVDIRSKADALFIKQACRLLSNPEETGAKHIKYWLGLYLGRYLPELRPGAHSEGVPDYYRHFRRLLEEVIQGGDVYPEELEKVKVKDLYLTFTETLPPPKVVYKHALPWEDIWRRIHHPMLTVNQRELMFLLVHNILPTKERLLKMNQVETDQCEEGDGVETLEHLFCGCRRTQVAWAWMRRKVSAFYPQCGRSSNFELLNLVTFSSDKQVEKDIIWLISTFVEYVWKQKLDKRHYFIDLDVFKPYLQLKFLENQKSQNKVSINLLC